MDKFRLKTKYRILLYVAVYIATVALIFLMLPKASTLDPYYEVGKPWTYEPMIAPDDFPIYKTDARVEAERDSIQRELVPYLNIVTIDRDAAYRNLELLKGDGPDKVAYEAMDRALHAVYDAGILSADDKAWMDKTGISSVVLVDENRNVRERSYADLLTVNEAYNRVEQSMQEQGIELHTIKRLKAQKYISINLELDRRKTEEARRELIATVLPTSGMVMKGERIVDKGEVVTPEIAQEIVSMRALQHDVDEQRHTGALAYLSHILLLAIFYGMLWAYLILFRPRIFARVSETLFLMLSSLLIIAVMAIVVRVIHLNEYLVPFAMLPLVVRVFFDSRTALYVHLITVLSGSLFAANAAEFLIIEIIAGMVAVSSMKDINSRSQLVQASLYVFLTYMAVYVSLRLAVGVRPEDIDWWTAGTFFINTIALLLTYGVIYIVEKAFGFLSDVSLVELSNVNSPLLMEFATKCPGTFQHVLQVSNLAVMVARRINANPLLVRAGAMYHDLGKMQNPLYFTENQTPGINPTNQLDLIDAAQVIINHVSDGVKIAKKNHLPYQIIEFIVMHHGTSKTKYFYNSYVNAHPGEEVPVEKFTYPGPLPQTKETVILMMADSIEAASRSLKEYTEEAIGRLVDNIVNAQMMDGQFADAPITFRDIEIAKQAFKEELMTIYHSRISYPEIKKDEERRKPFSLAKDLKNFPRRFTKR